MQGILLQRRNDIECINDINMDLITVIFTTFDYVTRHPFKGKILCRLNPSVREYLENYDWSEEKKYKVQKDYINAGRLFLKIMGYCWL